MLIDQERKDRNTADFRQIFLLAANFAYYNISSLYNFKGLFSNTDGRWSDRFIAM